MARRTTKKEENPGGFIAVILFLPFLIISVIHYKKLKNQYLSSNNSQRVIDFYLMPAAFLLAVGLTFFAFFFAFAIAYLFGVLFSGTLGLIVKFIFIVLFSSIGFYTGSVFAKYLAIIYLGIVGDKSKNILILPHDMNSYGIEDYLSFKFMKDFCTVDIIKLSEITKMTRGRGVELYIHGPFGSRKIQMSSKQKRDECIAMIQSLTGKKRLLSMELETY